ncbi:DUF2125 domain-containing protein [Acetobacteraceae bacterium H6797]|nr:DUF2125 domain-containing protein [Acetobacteraceae bacterium H6797]
MSAKTHPRPSSPRPSSRRGFRLALVALAAIVLLGIGHTLLWRWMGNQLEAGLRSWTEARRAQGWEVDYGTPVRGGWPLAATLTLPNLHLVGGGTAVPGGIDWQAGAVTLRVGLPHVQTLIIDLPDPQRLGTHLGDLSFAAERLEGRVTMVSGIPPREAEIIAEGLRVGTASGALTVRSLNATVDSRSTATESEAAVMLKAHAEDAQLPQPSPLGQTVQSVDLEAALTGPTPPGRQPRERAAAWRDSGGTLELRSLTMHWGQLGLSGAATMALDGNLQPMGAGTLRLTGAEALVDALASTGTIDPRNAGLVKAMLSLVTTKPADGGAPQVELPLTLERQRLSAARIPLMKMPAIDWPTEPVGP